MLIPSYAAGSIIGKGGQTIVQLQKETGATIKLSKSKDFYPGKPQTRQVPELDLALSSPLSWDCGSHGGGLPSLPIKESELPATQGAWPEQMGVGAGPDNELLHIHDLICIMPGSCVPSHTPAASGQLEQPGWGGWQVSWLGRGSHPNYSYPSVRLDLLPSLASN